ncbi:MAG: hypothetical protein WCS37_20955 [Chloroflexota bacterium]
MYKVEKKFFRALVLALAINAALSAGFGGYHYYRQRANLSFANSMVAKAEAFFKAELGRYTSECAAKPVPYAFCTWGDNAIANHAYNNHYSTFARDTASQYYDLMGVEEDMVDLTAKVSAGVSALLLTAFYGLRWVLTGRRKPLIPK